MHKIVLNKYNPIDKRSHSILKFFAEDLSENDQIVFVRAIFNKGSWILPAEISKSSQSPKIKEFAEERFYEIFKEWVNDRLEHNSRIAAGKRSLNIPKTLISNYNEAIFSIRNLGFPSKVMSTLEMLLLNSHSAYMKDFYESSFSLVIEDFSEEELEIFFTYFLEKHLQDPSTIYVQFFYGFLEKLAYSSKIFSLSSQFIQKLNLLSDYLKKEDYKNDYKIILSILHIELIDKKELDLSNSSFESLIEETISSLDERNLNNLIFFRFLKLFNYPFNTLDVKLNVEILFQGIEDNLSKIEFSDESKRHLILLHFIESDNLYFELFLFYLSLSSKEFAEESLIRFIKLSDKTRAFFSSTFLWFEEYLNYKIIKGGLSSYDRSGFYVQIDETLFKTKLKQLKYELSSEELLNKYKQGFIHIGSLRNFKEYQTLIHNVRKQKTKGKVVLADNYKIDGPSSFLIESANYSVGSKGTILRLIPIDDELIKIVSKYQLKAYLSSLEVFFINNASHILNRKSPIPTRSYLFKSLFTFNYFDEYKFELSPESLKEILQEFRPQLYEQLYIIPEKQEKSFVELVRAYNDGTVVKGFIKSRTPGGMFVEILDSIAFLPGSQIDVKPIRDYDIYVGKTMEFKVVKINHDIKNVVVSHKALIEADIEEHKMEIISQLEKGQVLEGVVKNIASYGVFVDLGGVDGLIHITDLSWSRKIKPAEMVKKYQSIKVVVLDFKDDKTRIQLGVKQFTADPWDEFVKHLKINDIIIGEVIEVLNHGAFVEVAEGVEGLIHVSEMSWSTHLRSAQELVKVGDEVKAVVLTVDKEQRKINLGIKQLTADPWSAITLKYPVGSRHRGIVRNFSNFGVFLQLEEGIDGLIYISDLSWTKKIKHPSEFTNIGDTLEVVVLELDVEGRKLSLGHKQTEENPWNKYEDEFAIGTKHMATIAEVVDKGAIINFNDDIVAFVPLRELKKEDGSLLKKGDDAEFLIIEFNKEFKKVVASHIAIYKPQKKLRPRIKNDNIIPSPKKLNFIGDKLNEMVKTNQNAKSEVIKIGSKILLEPYGKDAAWFCIGRNTSTCQKINEDSIFAKRLINKRVGDIIDFGNGFKVLLVL